MKSSLITVIIFISIVLAPLVTSGAAGASKSPQESNALHCFNDYVAASKRDRQTAFNFFSKKFVGNQLNDLLMSNDEDVIHNMRAVRRMMFLSERFEKINRVVVTCPSASECTTDVIYENRQGNTSNVVLHQIIENGARCPLIDKIQINVTSRER